MLVYVCEIRGTHIYISTEKRDVNDDDANANDDDDLLKNLVCAASYIIRVYVVYILCLSTGVCKVTVEHVCMYVCELILQLSLNDTEELQSVLFSGAHSPSTGRRARCCVFFFGFSYLFLVFRD